MNSRVLRDTTTYKHTPYLPIILPPFFFNRLHATRWSFPPFFVFFLGGGVYRWLCNTFPAQIFELAFFITAPGRLRALFPSCPLPSYIPYFLIKPFFSRGHATTPCRVSPSVGPSVGPLVRHIFEFQAVFELLLLPNQPRLDCRVSGLIFSSLSKQKSLNFTSDWQTEVQLGFTRAHFKGLSQIMPYSEAALLPTWKWLRNLLWDRSKNAL